MLILYKGKTTKVPGKNLALELIMTNLKLPTWNYILMMAATMIYAAIPFVIQKLEARGGPMFKNYWHMLFEIAYMIPTTIIFMANILMVLCLALFFYQKK